MRVGARQLNALSPAPAGPPRSHAPARQRQSRRRCPCGLALSHSVVARCGGLSPPAHASGAARGRYDHKLDVFSYGLLLWEWFARELVHREIEVIDRSIGRSAIIRRCNRGCYAALQQRVPALVPARFACIRRARAPLSTW